MRRAALAGALVALAVAFFFLRPPPTPGPPMRDFEAYYAAGSSWLVGDDPYSRQIWRAERAVPGVNATREELLPFVGPPFGLLLWSLFGRLSYLQAAFAWGVVLSVALVVLALGSLRLASGSFGPFEATAALAFCGGFGPLTSGLALGQVAVVACASIVATLLFLRTRWTVVSAACISIAALQPNVAAALVVRLRERRSWIAFALALAVTVGGSVIVLGGADGIARYLNVLREHGAAERFIAIQTTPAAVARALGAGPALAQGIAIALALVVGAALVSQWASRRYDDTSRVALSCAALPLAIPFAHEHDFTLAFFPAILCARRATGRAWIVGTIGTLLVAVDWLGLAQRPAGIAQSALLALAAALALVALAPGPLRALQTSPALIGLAVVGAGAFVAQHPLPIWPDALPATFRPSPALSPGAVWFQEQSLSGIAALDPHWGALRLLSLLGCALLWAAAAVTLQRRVLR